MKAPAPPFAAVTGGGAAARPPPSGGVAGPQDGGRGAVRAPRASGSSSRSPRCLSCALARADPVRLGVGAAGTEPLTLCAEALATARALSDDRPADTNASRAKPLHTAASRASRGAGRCGRADAHSLSPGRRPQVPQARLPTASSAVGAEESCVRRRPL